MNARQRAIRIAQRTNRKATGGPVRYERDVDGETLTCEIDYAGRGTTSFERLDENGVVSTLIAQDFLIATDEVVFLGNVSTPQLFDRIVETDCDGEERIYMVLDFNGMPRWRYSDTWRMQLRIHTKVVKEPTP